MHMQHTSPNIPIVLIVGMVLGLATGLFGLKALLLIVGAPVVLLLLLHPQWCFWLLVAAIPVTIDFGQGLTVTRVVIPVVALGILSNALIRRCPWPNPLGSTAARVGSLFFLSILLSLAVAWLTQRVPLDMLRLNKELAGYATRVAMFFVTLSFVRRPQDVRQVVLVLVLVGILEALIVVAQIHFRLVLPGDWRFSSIARVDSTEGTFRAEGTTPHPIYLAGFLQMVLPFAVLLLLRARLFWRLPLATAIALMLYAWYAAYSRSSLLALVLMLAVALYFFTRFGRAVVVIGFLGFLALLAAHAWSLPDLAQTLEEIRHFGKAVRSDQLTSVAGSLQFRIESSVGGWNLFMAHPLFGVGLAQAIHEYMQYLPGWAVSPFHPEVIHNSFFEVASENGVFALFFLLWLWFIAFRGVASAWNDPELSFYARALFVALVGQVFFLSMTPMVRDIWFTLPLAAAFGEIMTVKARKREDQPDAPPQTASTSALGAA